MSRMRIGSNIFPFVDSPADIERMKLTSTVQLRMRLDNGGELTDDEKNTIFSRTDNGRKGGVRLYGWYINFSDVMNLYFVSQYDHAETRFAFSKLQLLQDMESLLEFAETESEQDEGRDVIITEINSDTDRFDLYDFDLTDMEECHDAN